MLSLANGRRLEVRPARGVPPFYDGVTLYKDELDKFTKDIGDLMKQCGFRPEARDRADAPRSGPRPHRRRV